MQRERFLIIILYFETVCTTYFNKATNKYKEKLLILGIIIIKNKETKEGLVLPVMPHSTRVIVPGGTASKCPLYSVGKKVHIVTFYMEPNSGYSILVIHMYVDVIVLKDNFSLL